MLLINGKACRQFGMPSYAFWVQIWVYIQQKPDKQAYCGEDEIRTRGRDCSLRRFSKPVVSATHPPLLESGLSLFLRRKVNAFFLVVQIFIAFIRGRLIFCGYNTHVCSELSAVNIFDVIAAALRLCLKLVKIWRIGK